MTQQKGTPAGFLISQDPDKNGGSLGEITLTFPYKGQPKAVPLDIEIRYSLHRGDSGLYGWTIADHDPRYPAFDIAVCTFCMKLDPDLFDFLSIDSRRQRQMASADDWVKGTQLNLWEARRLNSGIRKGEVEHKYDYTMLFSRTPAWGWSSTRRKIGLFVVNPSIEYLGGAAGVARLRRSYRREGFTARRSHAVVHLAQPALRRTADPDQSQREVEKNRRPVSHVRQQRRQPRSPWKDALARADREKNNWPYQWASAPGYEHAERTGECRRTPPGQGPTSPQSSRLGRLGRVSPTNLTKRPSRKKAPSPSTGKPTASTTNIGPRPTRRDALRSPMRDPAPTRSTLLPTESSAISAAPTCASQRARRPNSAT